VEAFGAYNYAFGVGRTPDAQARLDRAVAAIDRELAANLELTSMFDQTKQAFVLENGQWHLHGAVVAKELPAAHAFAADLYARMPDAESAMERRGPANSLKDEDREIVEGWEGDAREAQRRLRAELARPDPPPLRRIMAWLFGWLARS
jgi:hypothetical protein